MDTNKPTISFNVYRTTDLITFTFIACVLEYLNVFVFKNFFTSELYTLSIMLPITLIVMQRWNGYALVPAILTGLVYCIANKAENPATYITYIAGNCFIMINLVWQKAVGKKKLEESILCQILYTVTGYILMSVGRAGIAAIFEGSFFANLKTFLIADEISGVIGIIIVIVAARQKDLFKDQKEYLKEQVEGNTKNIPEHDKISRYTADNNFIEEEDIDEGRTDDETYTG